MLLRILAFGLLALGLGSFGVVAFIATRATPPAQDIMATPSAPPRRLPAIVAAASALRAGMLVRPDDLTRREVDAPLPDSIDDTGDARSSLVGAMLRNSVAAGQPIRAGDVVRPGDHGFLAAVLAPGMRATSIGVDSVSGIAGLVWPGDRVDLILTQSIDDQSLPLGHRVVAETVLSDLRVIAIDQQLARGTAPGEAGASNTRTVTLEVDPDQASRMAVAARLGRLSLSVRAVDQPRSAPQPPATWGGDVSPALASPLKAAPAAETGVIVRVYRGGADGKEFRF